VALDAWLLLIPLLISRPLKYVAWLVIPSLVSAGAGEGLPGHAPERPPWQRARLASHNPQLGCLCEKWGRLPRPCMTPGKFLDAVL
jgi:hypothetical protein